MNNTLEKYQMMNYTYRSNWLLDSDIIDLE